MKKTLAVVALSMLVGFAASAAFIVHSVERTWAEERGEWPQDETPREPFCNDACREEVAARLLPVYR